jgi:hypothetical protein
MSDLTPQSGETSGNRPKAGPALLRGRLARYGLWSALGVFAASHLPEAETALTLVGLPWGDWAIELPLWSALFLLLGAGVVVAGSVFVRGGSHTFLLLAVLGAVVLFLLFPERAHRGDAGHCIAYAPHAQVHLRQVLPRAAFTGAYQLQRTLGPRPELLGSFPDAERAIALVSRLCGALGLVVLLLILRRFHAASPVESEAAWPNRAFLATALAVGTFGLAQLGFGHIEVYPVFVLVVLVYAWTALGGMPERLRPVAIGGALAVALWSHLAAIWLVPSAWMVVKDGPGRLRRLMHLGGGFVIGGALVLAGVMAGYGVSLGELSGAAWREVVETPGGWVEGGRLLSAGHWLGLVREYLLLAWGLPFLLGWRRLRTAWKDRDPAVRFLIWMSLPLVAWSLVWEQKLGPVEDWDLFTVVAVPLALLGAWLVLKARAARGLVLPLVLLHCLHTALFITANSLTPSAVFPQWFRFADAVVVGKLPEAPLAVHFTGPQSVCRGEPFRLDLRLERTADGPPLAGYLFLVRADGAALFFRGVWLPEPGPAAEPLVLPPGEPVVAPALRWNPAESPRLNDHLPGFLRPGEYRLCAVILDKDLARPVVGASHLFRVVTARGEPVKHKEK